MILSDLPSPAEASSQIAQPCKGFVQVGNRLPSPMVVRDMLFGTIRYGTSL
jgi:hypothetical protein